MMYASYGSAILMAHYSNQFLQQMGTALMKA